MGSLRLERQYRAWIEHRGRPAGKGDRLADSKRWFVGIDWASQEHQVCLIGETGDEVVGEGTFAHSGEGLAQMCVWLEETTRAGMEAMEVAIETTHGAVVELLLERGARVYALNPKQLDRFRDRFTVAGAKDDRRDAMVLARSLRTDRDRFRLLRLDTPEVIELREWSRMAAELGNEQVALGNRIREQLQRYYPQMLEIAKNIAAPWFLELWQKVPTPADAARVEKSVIAELLKRNRVRRFQPEQLLSILRRPPLRVAAGTTAAATAHIESLVERLCLVNAQRRKALGKLDELCARLSVPEDDIQREHRDVVILRSLPGLGRINIAALLAEASQPLEERNYHVLRALSAAAPVTRATGKRSGDRAQVVMRRACNPRLRDAVYHWARVSVRCDPSSHRHYQELRARGKRHGRALRGVADRLLKVACAMLRDGTLYDPSRRQGAGVQKI